MKNIRLGISLGLLTLLMLQSAVFGFAPKAFASSGVYTSEPQSLDPAIAAPTFFDASIVPLQAAMVDFLLKHSASKGKYDIRVDMDGGKIVSIRPVFEAYTDNTAGLSKPDKSTRGKLIFPTKGVWTQGFHSGHYAIDIANPDRPAVWAAADGVVLKAKNDCKDISFRCGGGYGNHIIIDHGNGLRTLYGHLTNVTVKEGDHVTKGQVIGKMGRSGHVQGRTGIFLHFEVRKNGQKQNPSNYF